jgi:hypothetical protein
VTAGPRMSDLLPFAAVAAADAGRVGGKGESLARTAAAGLPVRPGSSSPPTPTGACIRPAPGPTMRS